MTSLRRLTERGGGILLQAAVMQMRSKGAKSGFRRRGNALPSLGPVRCATVIEVKGKRVQVRTGDGGGVWRVAVRTFD